MAGAAPYDMNLKRGFPFELPLTWCNPVVDSDPPIPDLDAPINLTGYHAKLQIRDRPSSAFVSKTLDDLTGGIVLGGMNGTITILLTAADTLALGADFYYYDLAMIPPSGWNAAVPLIEGQVYVEAGVTQQ